MGSTSKNRWLIKATIKIPISIDEGLRNRIKKVYLSIIEEAGEAERQYVKERFPRVLKRVQCSNTSWTSNLCVLAETFFNLINEKAAPGRRLLPEAERAIVSALFYFCNPYDVMPDYTPGIGYVDDALVFDDCLKRLKKLQPTLFKREPKP